MVLRFKVKVEMMVIKTMVKVVNQTEVEKSMDGIEVEEVSVAVTPVMNNVAILSSLLMNNAKMEELPLEMVVIQTVK